MYTNAMLDEEILTFVRTRVPSVKSQLRRCLSAAASTKQSLDVLAIQLSYSRIYITFRESDESRQLPTILYRIGEYSLSGEELGEEYTLSGLAESFGVEIFDDIEEMLLSLESGIGSESTWVFASLPTTINLYNGSVMRRLEPEMPAEEKQWLWAAEFASTYLNNVVDLEISESQEAGEGFPFEVVKEILDLASLVLPKYPLTLFNWGRYREEAGEWELAIKQYEDCKPTGFFPTEMLDSRIATARATWKQWVNERV